MSAILLHHALETASPKEYALVDECQQTQASRVIPFRQVAPLCMTNLMNMETTDRVH